MGVLLIKRFPAHLSSTWFDFVVCCGNSETVRDWEQTLDVWLRKCSCFWRMVSHTCRALIVLRNECYATQDALRSRRRGAVWGQDVGKACCRFKKKMSERQRADAQRYMNHHICSAFTSFPLIWSPTNQLLSYLCFLLQSESFWLVSAAVYCDRTPTWEPSWFCSLIGCLALHVPEQHSCPV